MALPGTIGDPLKPIKDKLDDIERAVDKLSKDNAKDNSEEITEIKESIQSISKLLKNIVDGMETDEVRLQNRTEMESHITQSVNDNINTQMSNIKNDLKQTKFSVTLKEDQLQMAFATAPTVSCLCSSSNSPYSFAPNFSLHAEKAMPTELISGKLS